MPDPERPPTDVIAAGGATRASPAAELALGLRALRARQWAHFAPLPLAGAPLADMFSGACPLGHVLWACLGGALCLAWAYGLNAHADRRTDSRGKNPLAGAASGPLALLPALVCGPLAMLAATHSGGLAPACVSLVAGALYSFGLRLKRRPGAGTLANAAIFAPLLALVGAPRGPGFVGVVAVFTALLLQNQLVHERADEVEDRRAGAHTSAQWLGRAGVARVGRWLALLGSATAIVTLGPWAGLVAAWGLAVGAWLSGQADPVMARRRHRALALATGAVLYALAPGGGG